MSRPRHRSDVPLGVKTTAFLVALDGVVALVEGLGAFGVSVPLGLALIALGLLHVLVAAGIWQLEPYAYTGGMVVFAVGLIVDLVTGNVYAAGLSALNMYVLYHYRGLFRR